MAVLIVPDSAGQKSFRPATYPADLQAVVRLGGVPALPGAVVTNASDMVNGSGQLTTRALGL